MPNRLSTAVSPYLRSHADNPVDWFEWGTEPFAEAQRRQVPVLISIGYSTCHWCHVMARESFSDPELAAWMNERFVSIKVDREEHPDVDASYLTSAGAFTEQLGWPLTVFATPEGKTFYAGTYFPPIPVQGRPSFRQVMDAVLDAFTNRRAEVDSNANQIADHLSAQRLAAPGAPGPLPSAADFAAILSELSAYEDAEFGGFGGAPKFPVAPVLGFLLDRESAGDAAAGALARRTLDAMASSALRDPVEGGFFRYAVNRDWTDPHYERMLYDNALLLGAYARIDRLDVVEGIASFLLGTMRIGVSETGGGGFASAQDSESTVYGVRVEGGYYRLDSAGRAGQTPPALDEKVLTGWNGLAIEALAFAGARFGRADWVQVAREVAELLSAGDVIRARIGGAETGVQSSARPTLEDYGMLANGLIEVSLATGEARYAVRARELVQAALDAATSAGAAESGVPFLVPGGADPVLTSHGLALPVDPSEGAYPSGLSATARAALRLHRLSGDRVFLQAAIDTMAVLAPFAVQRPISFGAALTVMSELDSGARQLVVVTAAADADAASSPLTDLARGWLRSGTLVSVVTEAQVSEFSAAGFELYEGRTSKAGQPTAYLCEDFVCQLPVTGVSELQALLL